MMIPNIRIPIRKGISIAEYFVMIRLMKLEIQSKRHDKKYLNTDKQETIGIYGAVGKMHSPYRRSVK